MSDQPDLRPAADPLPAEQADHGLGFAERAKGKSLAEKLKQPISIAAIVLTSLVIGFVFYLEGFSFHTGMSRPEISYELLRNEGLTDGVPIAIKMNQVAVFKISDPMLDGAERAKEVIEQLEAVLDDLEAEPGRIVTIDIESSRMPSIIQTKSDGTQARLLIQLTPDDIALSGQKDPKWLARVWAERVTDVLKVFLFGEPPKFTVGIDFGKALTTMYVEAIGERGGVSSHSLELAYVGLSEEQQLALVEFPAPPPEDGRQASLQGSN